MRENSGKGDSNTGLLDPTIKEHEADKGRSGQAALDPSERTAKNVPASPTAKAATAETSPMFTVGSAYRHGRRHLIR